MDELDTKIIGLLQRDGRASNAGIAREVGVSEGTVRRRLKRLIEEEYIRVVAIPDPSKMGYSTEALIGIQADPAKIDTVASDLGSLDEVKWISATTGTFDIFAWAALTSAEELGIFLRTKVGVISGVRRTETFVSLSLNRRGSGMVI